MAQLYQTEITAAELREDLSEISREALIEEFQEDARDEYEAKEEEFGSELMRELERFIVLQVVDVRWREHLENMEALREGIHLRSMAQKDPLVEYTGEGDDHVHRARARDPQRGRAPPLPRRARARGGAAAARAAVADRQREHPLRARDRGRRSAIAAAGGEELAAGVPSAGVATQTVRANPNDKLGRNDPCWCGTGKKFKKCHGA